MQDENDMPMVIGGAPLVIGSDEENEKTRQRLRKRALKPQGQLLGPTYEFGGNKPAIRTFSITDKKGRVILLGMERDESRSEDDLISEGIERFKETGEHLGVYETEEAADVYSKELERRYHSGAAATERERDAVFKRGSPEFERTQEEDYEAESGEGIDGSYEETEPTSMPDRDDKEAAPSAVMSIRREAVGASVPEIFQRGNKRLQALGQESRGEISRRKRAVLDEEEEDY